MPDGFKIASAYVEVKAEIDQTSAEDAGKLIGDTASKAAGEIKLKANADETSAAEAGKKIGDTASASAQNSAQQGGGMAGSLLIAGIAAAAPVAGAAVLAGVGLGFIGLAALAEKGNQDVQASFKGMVAGVEDEAKSASAQLTGALAGGIDILNKEAQAATPALYGIMAAIEPSIPIVATGIGQMANNLLPGMTAAAQNSQPVMSGLANLLEQVGTTGSDMLIKLSTNSQNFANSMVSTGSIVHTAGGLLTNVIVDMGTVWGSNFTTIDSTIGGVGRAVSGLASGAVPVLGAALGVVTTDATAVLNILGPLTPVLGGLGTAAALAWGGFQLAKPVAGWVTSAGDAIVNLGASVADNSPKLGNLIGDIGIGTSEMAGPFSAAVVGGGVVLGALAMVMDKTTISASDLTNAQQSLTAAMVSSNGTMTAASTGALIQSDAYKTLVPLAQQAGVTQQQLIAAITQGGPAFDNLQTQLQNTTNANVTYSTNGRVATTQTTAMGEASQALSQGLGQLRGSYSDAATAAQAAADATKALAQEAPAASLNTSQLAANMGILKDNTQNSSAQLNAWLSNVKLIGEGGTQTASDAVQAVWTQLNALQSSLKGTSGNLLTAGGDFDLMSTRGEAARTALEQIQTQTNTYYQALLNQGMGTQQAAQKSDDLANQLVGPLAKALGISQDSARNLLNIYQAYPSQVSTTVTANTQPALSAMQAAINWGNSQLVTLHVQTAGAGSATSMLHGQGDIVPAYHAAGDIVPIAPAAQVVPAGQLSTPDGGMNIVGDRHDVPEAYIPLDTSSRSRELAAFAAAATGASSGVTNNYQPQVTILTNDPTAAAQQLLAEMQWLALVGRAA